MKNKPIIKYILNEKGFTLLETLIALSLMMLVTLSATNILNFASMSNSRAIVNHELFENARITIDFMTEHIRRAEEINLNTDEKNTMKSMELTYRSVSSNGSVSWETNRFSYDKNLSAGAPRYNRVEFGGNELSSYIADIKITVENEILQIVLITDSNLNMQDDIEVIKPITLKTKIDVRYKDVIVTII